MDLFIFIICSLLSTAWGRALNEGPTTTEEPDLSGYQCYPKIPYYLTDVDPNQKHYASPVTSNTVSMPEKANMKSLKLSFCTSSEKDRGIDDSICFPLPFWVNICDANLKDAEAMLQLMLYTDEDEITQYDWREACSDYSLTWPFCITKKDQRFFCKLWKKVPKWERTVLEKLFIEEETIEDETEWI